MCEERLLPMLCTLQKLKQVRNGRKWTHMSLVYALRILSTHFDCDWSLFGNWPWYDPLQSTGCYMSGIINLVKSGHLISIFRHAYSFWVGDPMLCRCKLVENAIANTLRDLCNHSEVAAFFKITFSLWTYLREWNDQICIQCDYGCKVLCFLCYLAVDPSVMAYSDVVGLSWHHIIWKEQKVTLCAYVALVYMSVFTGEPVLIIFPPDYA